MPDPCAHGSPVGTMIGPFESALAEPLEGAARPIDTAEAAGSFLRDEERDRRTFWKAAQRLLSALGTAEIAPLVVSGLCDLFHVDGALLFLLDEGRAALHGVAASQIAFEDMVRRRIELALAPACARVIEAKQPLWLTGCQGVAHPDARMSGDASLGSTLLVPLIVRGEAIGMVSLYDTGGMRRYIPEEVELVLAFCSLAAIAIDKARLYRTERETVARLHHLGELAAAQDHLLRQVVSIDARLTRMVVEQLGVRALATAFSLMVGLPTMLLDSTRRVITYAGLDEDMLRLFTAQGDDRSLAFGEARKQARASASEVAEVRLRLSGQPDSGYPALVAPLVAASRVMGYLILIGNRPFCELDRLAIEHAAAVFAIELRRSRTALEAEERLRGAFVDDLLSGTQESVQAMGARAADLGVDLPALTRVLIVEGDAASTDARCREGDAEPVRMDRKVAHVVTGVFQSAGSKSICAEREGGVVVLLAEPEADPSRTSPDGLIATLREQVKRKVPGVTVSVAVGRRCASPADFAASYLDARAAMNLIRKIGRRDSALSFDDLKPYHLIIKNNSRQELLHFVDEALAGLERYDATHRTNLLNTLAAYFQHHRDLRTTARELYIHVNTLLYRLQKIRELLEVDLDNMEDQFKLQMALKIRQLFDRYQ